MVPNNFMFGQSPKAGNNNRPSYNNSGLSHTVVEKNSSSGSRKNNIFMDNM